MNVPCVVSSKRFGLKWRPTDGTATNGAGSALETGTCSDSSTVLDEFTAAWEQGEAPSVEEYLNRLDPADSQAAVELIYREYCLSEANGCKQDVGQFLSRFPCRRILSHLGLVPAHALHQLGM